MVVANIVLNLTSDLWLKKKKNNYYIIFAEKLVYWDQLESNHYQQKHIYFKMSFC